MEKYKEYKNYIILSFFALIIILISFHLLYLSFFAENVLEKKIEKSLRCTMEYLVKIQDSDGRFLYNISLSPALKIEKQNAFIARSFGTIRAMYEYEDVVGDKTFKDSRIKATKYLFKNNVKQIEKNLYAPVSFAKDENIQNDIVYTSSVALALMSSANMYNSGLIDNKIITGIADFLLYLQKLNGDFYSYYQFPDKKITATSTTQLFYNGESVIALIDFYNASKKEKYLEAAKKTLFYEISKNINPKFNEIDNWNIIAAAYLYENEKNKLTNEEQNLIYLYAGNVSKTIMKSQNLKDYNNISYGDFNNITYIYAVASYMDGLGAASLILKGSGMDEKLKKSLQASAVYIMRNQIKSGKNKGAFPNYAFKVSKDINDLSLPEYYVQIDNMGHVITALLKYIKFIEK